MKYIKIVIIGICFFIMPSTCLASSVYLLAVGQSNGLWTRETLTSSWESIPNSGNVIDVAVMPDGKILGVGKSNNLWVRNSLKSSWESVPNSINVIAITVLSNGTIIGVGQSNGLWTRETLTSSWESIPNSGNVIAVTDGGELKTQAEGALQGAIQLLLRENLEKTR